ANRPIGIEADDADFPCCGENCRDVAGRMHREVNERPSRRRHIGTYGTAVTWQDRERALWTVLKDGVKSLLKQDDRVICRARLCDRQARDGEIYGFDRGSFFRA